LSLCPRVTHNINGITLAAAMAAQLTFLTVPALTRHTSTVIFIPGLGDTGHGWKPIAEIFRMDPGLSHVKWVLPHSPTRRVTANMGMEIPSWFDIYSFGFNTDEDEKGMLESVKQLSSMIKTEVDSGIDPSHIVLGGFSQGGTMSLLTGLTGEWTVGGIAALSAWLPLKNKFKALSSPHANATPVFWGHGTTDALVRFKDAVETTKYLTTQLGIPEKPTSVAGRLRGLEFHVYEGMGHGTNQTELDDLRTWIKKAVPQE